MRMKLLVKAVALGMMTIGVAAVAAPITFKATGAFQTFVAPVTGVYNIVAFGAQGGYFCPSPRKGKSTIRLNL